jgi:hypothetical protein
MTGDYTGRKQKTILQMAQLIGQDETINSQTITVLQKDADGKILLAKGTAAASTQDAQSNYAKGAIYIKTDVATGTSGVYQNIGTAAASSFSLANQVPSHVPKFAGEVTWTGGLTTLAETVTGALATDIVIATIQSAPSEAAYLVSAAVTANTVTFTLSAANTSNDAVVSYVVLRAAA